MMKTLQFQGSIKIDPSLSTHRRLIDQEFSILKDEEINLVLRHHPATDFDVYNRDILEGHSKAPNGQEKHHRSERLHGNLPVALVATFGAAVCSVLGLFSKDAKDLRDQSWQYAQFRTEPMAKFIQRSFQKFKTEIDAAKSTGS